VIKRLLVFAVGFVVAGYAVWRIKVQGGLVHLVVWMALAVVIHDLVAWPLYTLADRAAIRASARSRVPWINHVRVPAVMSAVLLLISLPLVLRLTAGAYRGYAGESESPYLWHWLAIVAALSTASAIAYVVRVVRSRRAGPRSPTGSSL
jgi:hypothetical protein